MLSDGGAAIVRLILGEIESGIRTLPTNISLQYLEKETGIRHQNIGSAFTPYIDTPLMKKGIGVKKCGRPVRIQLSNLI